MVTGNTRGRSHPAEPSDSGAEPPRCNNICATFLNAVALNKAAMLCTRWRLELSLCLGLSVGVIGLDVFSAAVSRAHPTALAITTSIVTVAVCCLHGVIRAWVLTDDALHLTNNRDMRIFLYRDLNWYVGVVWVAGVLVLATRSDATPWVFYVGVAIFIVAIVAAAAPLLWVRPAPPAAGTIELCDEDESVEV